LIIALIRIHPAGLSASYGKKRVRSLIVALRPVVYIASIARPLHIEFAGALFHVTSRGNRREPIFDDDEEEATEGIPVE